MNEFVKGFCKETGKQCLSKEDAQYILNRAKQKHWKRRMKEIPKRHYLCRFCGYYHLTKQKPHREGIEKRIKNKTRYTNERRRAARMEKDIYRYRREYQGSL